jgi:hypothetical protein
VTLPGSLCIGQGLPDRGEVRVASGGVSPAQHLDHAFALHERSLTRGQPVNSNVEVSVACAYVTGPT